MPYIHGMDNDTQQKPSADGVSVGAWIPRDEYEQLLALARADDRSVSWLIAKAIRTFLQEMGK